jgi:ABC transport system ATP-binding/permease protein
MSEEILKALTQLFAIITKQDGGATENERQFVIRFFQQELDHASVNEYIELYDKFSDYKKPGTEVEVEKVKLTSVKDSVKTLGICRKVNKTLTQKQKVIVLIKLLELVGSDKNFSAQRMEIINTVSTVFNISNEEYKIIEAFVVAQDVAKLNYSNMLVANSQASAAAENQKHLHVHIEGDLIFLEVPSVGMYFTKYLGEQQNVMNGFIMQPNRVYLYSHGSTIKMMAGDALYYSDLVAHFNKEINTTKLSFNARIDEFQFPNGGIGLRNVLIAEGPGKLIGIMGASGAGKTTLLNVLAGLEKSPKTEIVINGFDVRTQKDKIHGVIGYVPQDDLLIEELTVYQNLYFNAKLCFSHFTEEQLNKRTLDVLTNLGLEHRKDLKVGNPLEKTISGGQRKRLNIALELIREPAILFLDEPTSGLSSRDSENVIDLLKELSLKGKLIFVVIHQPSSDIYKMFDKMVIMDTGGYPVYYGSPVEAVTYFKKATHQVDSNRGQCEVCGNVNPEQIFNIIEAKVVDEYGQPTPKRKVTPPQWHEMYGQAFKISKLEEVKEEPPKSLFIPGRIKQTVIFTTRDLLAKISNKQYLLINLLEAPLLAAILAFVIRYRNAPGGKEYLFRFNDNIPAFILMSIIVALFMGLTVSAEEIIRDRKILKRESFLNLSWNSYLLSKLSILFMLSAIQTFLFVVVGHLMLGIHGMMLPYWLVLFTISCFANILGLNISSAFNSAVTVYVIIPLLIIPQMILSGTMFSFDKLNELISSKGKVPLVADMMASRWAYEAIAVHQFKNNEFQRDFFDYEKNKSIADFKSAYVAEELRKMNQYVLDNKDVKNDSIGQLVGSKLEVMANTLRNENFKTGIEQLDLDESFTPDKFTPAISNQLLEYINLYKKHYQEIYNTNLDIQEKKMVFYEKNGWDLNEYKNNYFNESLSDLVRNVNTLDRVTEYKGELIQQIDPIFQEIKPKNALDYRTRFFFSEKNLAGITVTTFAFDIIVIWIMSLLLYFTLYFELLRKLMNFKGVPNLLLKKKS